MQRNYQLQTININVNMETHANHSPNAGKKMDTLFLGISNAIPGCVLWVFGRELQGAPG
jgi:hypothetical protein